MPMKNYLKSDFEYSSIYRLTRLLGTGAFADVYLGEHIYLNSQVAIKVLHTQVDMRATADFLTEARHLSHLMHPHIIRVFDFGIENQTPYLVMDYAPHGNVRELHPPWHGRAALDCRLLHERHRLRLAVCARSTPAPPRSQTLVPVTCASPPLQRD